MGGGDPRSSSSQNGNVIDSKDYIGGAKYWYVDPRATGTYGPRNNLNQRFDPGDDEQGHDTDFINAVNRLLNPNTPMLSQPQATPTQYYRDPATGALNQFGM
jgi:hypothetical protein